MLTLENLNAMGADTAEGLARCYGNETLYLRLVKMLPAESNFDTLKSSLEQGDLDTAFQAAHALKGVVGNLSITPMYKLVSEITELLRARAQADYMPLVNEMLAMRDHLAALCKD